MPFSFLAIGGFILLVLVVAWGGLLAVAISKRSWGGIIALVVVGLVGLLMVGVLLLSLLWVSSDSPVDRWGPSVTMVDSASPPMLVSQESVSPSELGSDPDGQGLLDALAKTAKAVGLTNVQSGTITSTEDEVMDVSLQMQGDPSLLKPWLGAIEACTAPPMQVVSFAQPEAGAQGTTTMSVTVRLDAERLQQPAPETERLQQPAPETEKQD